MKSLQKDLSAVVVPVGGGGLLAGVSVVFKHHLPDVEVIVSFNSVDVGSLCVCVSVFVPLSHMHCKPHVCT